jgi:hypothetical protein
MSNATIEKRPEEQPAQPPEESVWKRYSPHNEAPLSTIGSLAIHALVIGVIVVIGIVVAMLGIGKSNQMPIDPVAFDRAEGTPGAQGGGGGGEKKKAALVEEERTKVFPEKKDLTHDNRPNLSNAEIARLPVSIRNSPDADLYIKAGSPNLEIFEKAGLPNLPPLPGETAEPNPGKDGPGVGPGGPGGSGGQGGDGGQKLGRRPKRMLRWTMLFDTTSGHNYVAQLESFGAILGIPKNPQGGDYWLIRDLKRRPAQLLNEDFTKLGRIQWTDSNPKSALDIATTLKLNAVPTHFIAFMPEALELKLVELEKAFKGLEEDQIFETKFMIVRTGSGYEPKVLSQTPKR